MNIYKVPNLIISPKCKGRRGKGAESARNPFTHTHTLSKIKWSRTLRLLNHTKHTHNITCFISGVLRPNRAPENNAITQMYGCRSIVILPDIKVLHLTNRQKLVR